MRISDSEPAVSTVSHKMLSLSFLSDKLRYGARFWAKSEVTAHNQQQNKNSIFMGWKAIRHKSTQTLIGIYSFFLS